MSSTPLSNYPEDLIISKGALNLDSALWASIIKSRPAYVHGADIQKIEHYKCTDGFEHEYLAWRWKWTGATWLLLLNRYALLASVLIPNVIPFTPQVSQHPKTVVCSY